MCQNELMKISTAKIEALTLDPRNARKHSSENLEAISRSLTNFGQRKPIVVTNEGVVVAGNGTLEAAKSLGWSEIYTVEIPSDWDADVIKAFAIADNRTAELAEWDSNLLATQLLELEEVEFDLADVGFPKQDLEDEPDPEFPTIDDLKDSTYKCPKCEYEWDGAPR